MFGGPGLPLARFLQSLSDCEVRRLLDSNVLAVLDGIFGGTIAGEVLLLMLDRVFSEI